jgi:hypothetical protein
LTMSQHKCVGFTLFSTLSKFAVQPFAMQRMTKT